MRGLLTIIFSSLLLFSSTTAFASYDEALALFKQHKYKASLKKVADILEVSKDLKPNSPNYKLRYLAAQNHMKLGNTQSAISHLKRCMGINMNSVDPYIDLSLYLIELKRYSDAKRYARDGIKIKEDVMLYYALGKITLMRKEYKRAKEFFEKANSIDSGIYVVNNGLGIALMKLRQYGAANAAFSMALLMNDKSVEIMNNLGFSYEKLKKYSEAKKYYKMALKLNPNSETIKANLSRVK